MIWKIFPIFILALSIRAQDPSISCNYTRITVDTVERYSCAATLNNPDGFDDFTGITGKLK